MGDSVADREEQTGSFLRGTSAPNEQTQVGAKGERSGGAA